MRGLVFAIGAGLLCGSVCTAQDYVYPSGDTPLNVLPGESESSAIAVPETFEVADLDVAVDVLHGDPADLLLALLSPDGRWVHLHNRTAGGPNVQTTFDDEGDAPDGPGALNDYDGMTALGTWQLFVTNFSTSQTASFNSWSLEFTARRSFGSTDTPINIANFQTINSVITVPDTFCVTDVAVDIDISHTAIGDLTVDLVSPSGTMVTLHNRSGGLSDDLQTLYDDDTNPPDGPGSLADFLDEVAAGDWTLVVHDALNFNVGRLNGWTLHLGGAVCPPVAHETIHVVDANDIGTVTLSATSVMGNPLRYTIRTLPDEGNLWTMDGTCITSTPFNLAVGVNQVQFKPKIGFEGLDTFRFRVDDGELSPNATVRVMMPVGSISEDFENAIPAGWPRVDLHGESDDRWRTASVYNETNYTNGSGESAMVDLRDWDPESGDFDIALYTPAIRLNASSSMDWTSNFQNVSQNAEVEISTDGGAAWQSLATVTPHGVVDAPPGADHNLSLSAFDGDTAIVRFRYSGTTGCVGCDEYWQIDDVVVTGEPGLHLADFNRDGIKNTSDLLAFLTAFVAEEPRTDRNTDCLINTSDFLAYLNDFNAP